MRKHATENGQRRRRLLVQFVEDYTGLGLEVVEHTLRGDRHVLVRLPRNNVVNGIEAILSCGLGSEVRVVTTVDGPWRARSTSAANLSIPTSTVINYLLYCMCWGYMLLYLC